jgi:sucrose-6-phosphate hydrolase SacC (GH32 family)
MSNWEYAQDVPTAPWRSAMTVPRQLSLRATPEGLRLIQQPVRELRKLRTAHRRRKGLSLEQANAWLAVDGLGPRELLIDFAPGSARRFGLKLGHGGDQATIITCDSGAGRLSLDRRRSGLTGFHPAFVGAHDAPLRLRDGRIRLHILVDTSSVEIFANDGETVITDLVFPDINSLGWECFSDAADIRILSADVWRLNSAW